MRLHLLSFGLDFARVHESLNEHGYPGWHVTATLFNMGSWWWWKLWQIPTWNKTPNSVHTKRPPKNNYFQLFNILCKSKLGKAITRLHSRRTSAELQYVCSLFQSSQHGQCLETPQPSYIYVSCSRSEDVCTNQLSQCDIIYCVIKTNTKCMAAHILPNGTIFSALPMQRVHGTSLAVLFSQ